MTPAGLPAYAGDPGEFLLELAYWFRSQGASLRDVHRLESAGADVVRLGDKLDEIETHYWDERTKREDLELELANIKQREEAK
jgi:hypothetical protein